MPVYEYECTSCGQTFEKLQSVSARAPRACPYCQKTGTVRRRVSAPAFQFKGSGWYVTDYAGKGKGGGAKKDESGGETQSDDKAAKSESKKDDAKDAKKDKKEESKPPPRSASKGDD